MRLIATTALVMVAFAANSILNRMALADGVAGPAAFGAIRMASGAIALALIARGTGRPLRLLSPRRFWTTLWLLIYILGFSFAYITLDAGIGALILFGGVQVTMFGVAVWSGDRPPWQRWIAMGIGLLGLAWLLWPGSGAGVPISGAVLMSVAALGWGCYSLIGRASSDPLGDTAGSFVAASPVVLAVWALSGEGIVLPVSGWGLAILSGVVTSGLGYALWYSVLPQLDRTVAGLAQLTVPVIAVAAGVVLLGESLTGQALLAGALVLGGVAFGILASGRSARGGRR